LSLVSFATIVTATVSLSCLGVFLGRASLAEGAPGAFVFGSVLSGLNAILSMGLLVWSRRRSHAAFMRALLGGMAGRMAMMLGAVAFGLAVLDLPQMPLLIGLLSHFVLFLALELGIVHRGWKPARAQ
jgi:hypothetical protein